jgi:TonB-linked SusC/RagA family outer membrane protein
MSTASAQEKTVSGKVSDDTGPLPGVSIIIKGTNKGTETDFDGNYAIQTNVGDVLVFSFVGMKSQEKVVGISNIIDVKLIADNVLEEVVIVGYGTQSKRTLTDNIVKLSSDDIQGVPTPNVLTSIAGKAAGVQISQTNGKVEGGLNFRIRGQASLTAGTNPLYVLDGIPLINNNESNNGAPLNPLLTLNPNEIESIDILKDASSAAIYGSRGANGVVIITTRKGKDGKSTFNLNFSNGISEASNKRDWLNAEQYIELFTEAAINGYDYGGWPTDPIAFVEGRFDRYSNGTWRDGTYDTDWQDLALVKGYTRDADFSMSGGNATTSYFFSGTYNDTKGIVDGNELDKYGARVNISHKLTNRFMVGMNMGYSRVNIDRIANDNAFVTPLQAIAQSPISPAFVDDEPFRNTVYANYLLQDKYAFYNTKIKRLTGKVFGEYKFTDWIKFNTDFAYDLYNQTEDSFTGRLAPFQSTNGEAFASTVNTENYILSNYLSFNKVFNDIHDLNLNVGTELTKSDRRYESVTGTEFPTDDFQTINSAAKITAGEGEKTAYSFVSYFARATYTINNKYLFKASVRRDGSSRFGKAEQFGTFPAFSAGWIISEEDFLSDSKNLSFLKVRGSWGKVGNAEIGNFASRGLFGGVSYNQRPGITPTQAGNDNLTWEESTQTDVSIEFGLFNNRITGDVAYYIKDTDGLIFGQPLPPSSGDPNGNGINKNIGRITSNGIEVTLQTKNVVTDDFTWTSSFNLGQNKNEIKELPGGNDVIIDENILREGEPINAFYLIEYAGVNPDNGDGLYYRNTDLGDGTLDRTTTNDPDEASRIVVGKPFPEWIGGLTNTFTYRDFDLSVTFQGEWGASIFNSAGRYQSANADWFDNQTADQLRRWQNPGDITDVPQARLGWGNGTAQSTRYLEKSDFIRLRNVTLGYNLPTKVLDKIKMSKVRIYFSGLNLLTFTDYEGYDPESRNDAFGVGYVFYSAPAAKTYSLGVNLSF